MFLGDSFLTQLYSIHSFKNCSNFRSKTILQLINKRLTCQRLELLHKFFSSHFLPEIMSKNNTIIKQNISLLKWKIYILLLGCYTRLSGTLIKKNLWMAKIMISNIYLHYRIPSQPTRWTNWPINYVHVSNINYRQFFPCHKTNVYSIFIIP